MAKTHMEPKRPARCAVMMRTDEATFAKLMTLAQAEGRSLSNMVEQIVKGALDIQPNA